mmetsp:Transcript_109785/g.316080  ORF Transcript_109785/g.316080 Transcript_109785/m.316080 type:complete len:251 (-) Transcript_109785:217-969(-)
MAEQACLAQEARSVEGVNYAVAVLDNVPLVAAAQRPEADTNIRQDRQAGLLRRVNLHGGVCPHIREQRPAVHETPVQCAIESLGKRIFAEHQLLVSIDACHESAAQGGEHFGMAVPYQGQEWVHIQGDAALVNDELGGHTVRQECHNLLISGKVALPVPRVQCEPHHARDNGALDASRPQHLAQLPRGVPRLGVGAVQLRYGVRHLGDACSDDQQGRGDGANGEVALFVVLRCHVGIHWCSDKMTKDPIQ